MFKFNFFKARLLYCCSCILFIALHCETDDVGWFYCITFRNTSPGVVEFPSLESGLTPVPCLANRMSLGQLQAYTLRNLPKL